jgi:hypothetical protein
MYIVEIDTTESCPYNEKCDFESVNVKVDRCRTCGYKITY